MVLPPERGEIRTSVPKRFGKVADKSILIIFNCFELWYHYIMFHTIATLNAEHHIDIVQDPVDRKIYARKEMSVYNREVYEQLREMNIKGIPRIKDVYTEDDRLIVIEEYISGQTLYEMLREGAVEKERILDYALGLCDILIRLQALKPPIVHRDIKPSNIIITSQDHVFLIDFNAARKATGQGKDTVLIGTAGYAAPEQYGFGASYPQADIFAVGALLKELTETTGCGNRFWNGIIRKCMEMDPKRRYKDAAALKNALLRKSRGDYVPPGFRTGNFWHAAIAAPVYAFLIWIAVTVTPEGAGTPALVIDRIYFLLAFMITIAIPFDYGGIQRTFSLCRSEKQAVRFLGVALMTLIANASLLLLVAFIELVLMK